MGRADNSTRAPGPTGHGRAAGGLAIAAAAGALLSLSPYASAQFMAQQGGNALSANFSNPSPYASTNRDFAAEARYRNSIVYGTAPGGLSFRGGLAPRDPYEFHGRLGSDDLQEFNRNSQLSTLASQGLRREQAFDAQATLATGSARQTYLPGRGDVNFNAFGVPRTYDRPQGAGGLYPNAALATNTQTRLLGGSAFRRDEQLDRTYNIVNRLDRSMKMMGEGSAGVGVGARLAGLTQNSSYTDVSRSGDLSDRLGVSSKIYTRGDTNLYRTDVGMGLGGDRTIAGGARARGLAERQIGESERSRSRVEPIRPGEVASNRIDTSALPKTEPEKTGGGTTALGTNGVGIDEMRKDLEKKYGPGIPGLPETGQDKGTGKGAGDTGTGAQDRERRLQGLRGQLQPTDSRPERMSLLDRSKGPGSGKPVKPATGTVRPSESGDRTKEGEEEGKTLRARIDPDTLKMIRDASGRVESLLDVETGKRDFYTEHMKAGQKLLADRMYFDAEERFGRALSLKPGDRMAQTGRIHAQIGAGLTLSAGQNLRRLIAENPEQTGLRYAQSLRPDPERTARLVEQLRSNIAGTGKLRRESALLIAYLGFQSGDVKIAREGLDAMEQVAREDPAARNGGDQRLVELLRGVWLDPKQYETLPAPAPDTPAGKDAGEKPRAPSTPDTSK